MNLSGTGNESDGAELYALYREREFTDVYERYADDIYRLCFSFMKNHMDAEDAVQETFLKFCYSDKKFESEKHQKAWLIVTASNYCKDMLKQHWHKRRSIEQIPETAGVEEPLVDEMMELILKLPDKYKLAVYLYYYEEYDSSEIAKMLKKPPSTVRTYLQKARKLLKEKLI